MIQRTDRTPTTDAAPVLRRGSLLRGANPHHRSTVFSVAVDPGLLAGRTTADLDPQFGERFVERFGALESLDPGGNLSPGFVAALDDPAGVPLVEVLLEAALCVERAARAAMLLLDPIVHAEVVDDPQAAGRVRLVWQAHSLALSRAAAATGLAGLLELMPETDGARSGGPGFEARLRRLRRRSRRRRRGPMIALLAQAARQRGLPTEALAGNYLRLGDGQSQQLVSESSLDRVDAPPSGPGPAPGRSRARAPRSLHRALVVGKQVVAIARIEPPAVTGDGRSSLADLVGRLGAEPQRHEAGLSPVRLAGPVLEALAGSGRGPDTVPDAGERVVLEGAATLDLGAVPRDVHERLHPEAAARLVEAAVGRGLSRATVDYRTSDVARGTRHGEVVAVRPKPEVTVHLLSGPVARDRVGRALLDELFDADATGRIPTAFVVGARGTRALARDVERHLRRRGEAVGLTTRAGSKILGRPVDPSTSGARVGPRFLLRDPRVAVLVAASSARRIVRRGAGIDHATVTAVLDPVGGRGGEDGVRVALRATTGAVVIDADHPLTASLLAGLDAARVLLVCERRDDRRARDHVEAGGLVVRPAEGAEFGEIELVDASGVLGRIGVETLVSPRRRITARRRRRALHAAALVFGLDRSVGAGARSTATRRLSARRN